MLVFKLHRKYLFSFLTFTLQLKHFHQSSSCSVLIFLLIDRPITLLIAPTCAWACTEYLHVHVCTWTWLYVYIMIELLRIKNGRKCQFSWVCVFMCLCMCMHLYMYVRIITTAGYQKELDQAMWQLHVLAPPLYKPCIVLNDWVVYLTL